MLQRLFDPADWQSPSEEDEELCILKYEAGEIVGWIIATDIHDARRKANGAMERDLANILYQMEFTPEAGKHDLDNGYILLC